VLVLPGLAQPSVAQKTAQLRQIAAQAGREICGGDSFSLSVGEAHYPEDGGDAEELLAAADRRMYKAKHSRKASLLSGNRPWQMDLHTTTVH
jgi:GGDEF domain-containing protein